MQALKPSVVALLLLLGGGCSRGETVVRREGKPDVHFVDSTDPGMRAAIDSARRSVSGLVARIEKPPAGQLDLGVKVRVVEGDVVEHLWMTDVSYDGSTLQGVVNNHPIDLTSVRLGDTLRVLPADITDWMAIEGGRLIAGYTIRLLRARMSPGDRARFDTSTRFIVQP